MKTRYGREYFGKMGKLLVQGLGAISLLAAGAVDGVASEPPEKVEVCEPVSVYGPRPCGSDEECAEENGPGWYCDKEASFGDGCGGTIVWPMCRNKPVPEVAPDAGTGAAPEAAPPAKAE